MKRSRFQTEPSPMLTDPVRRVILVGRTGLDQRLRQDPETEIIRAADTLAAIGELNDPPMGLENIQPIVVVGVLPNTPDPAGTPAQFASALCRVNPTVRVLLMSDADGAGQSTNTLSPEDSIETLLQRLDSAPPVSQAQPGPESQSIPTLETPPEPSASSEASDGQSDRPVEPAEPAIHQEAQVDLKRVEKCDLDGPEPEIVTSTIGDDNALIELLLKGRDIRARAVEIISRRLGREMALSKSTPNQHGWVPIVIGGTPVAWLGAPAGDPQAEDSPATDQIRQQAAWLSAWMRLEHQQSELRHAAFTDPLTGAWNRRYFDRYLSATFVQARAARQPVTVLVFDIDHFKTYNDRFGHAAGDEILIETVSLLRSSIRPTDRVCRIGGDEFAVIFYEPDGPRTKGSAPPMSVYSIATRFQRKICEHHFPKLVDDLHETLTISGGLATFPWDGSTPEALLARADELCLESKRAGKNAITLGVGAERVCRVDFPQKPESPPE